MKRIILTVTTITLLIASISCDLASLEDGPGSIRSTDLGKCLLAFERANGEYAAQWQTCPSAEPIATVHQYAGDIRFDDLLGSGIFDRGSVIWRDINLIDIEEGWAYQWAEGTDPLPAVVGFPWHDGTETIPAGRVRFRVRFPDGIDPASARIRAGSFHVTAWTAESPAGAQSAYDYYVSEVHVFPQGASVALERSGHQWTLRNEARPQPWPTPTPWATPTPWLPPEIPSYVDRVRDTRMTDLVNSDLFTIDGEWVNVSTDDLAAGWGMQLWPSTGSDPGQSASYAQGRPLGGGTGEFRIRLPANTAITTARLVINSGLGNQKLLLSNTWTKESNTDDAYDYYRATTVTSGGTHRLQRQRDVFSLPALPLVSQDVRDIRDELESLGLTYESQEAWVNASNDDHAGVGIANLVESQVWAIATRNVSYTVPALGTPSSFRSFSVIPVLRIPSGQPISAYRVQLIRANTPTVNLPQSFAYWREYQTINDDESTFHAVYYNYAANLSDAPQTITLQQGDVLRIQKRGYTTRWVVDETALADAITNRLVPTGGNTGDRCCLRDNDGNLGWYTP